MTTPVPVVQFRNYRLCACDPCACGTGHKACACPSPYYKAPKCTGPVGKHFTAIFEAASAAGWPDRFERDLFVHDFEVLRLRDASLPFIWTLGRHGTHLSMPEAWHGQRKSRELFRLGEAIDEAIGGGTKVRLYWWDGVGLHEAKNWDEIVERVEALWAPKEPE